MIETKDAFVAGLGRRALRGLAAVVLVAAAGSASAKQCVLPVPDGGDIEPSPASLEGRIVSASADAVVVQPKAGGKPVQVRLAAATELFTAYGGGIELKELAAGQYASVWFEKCAMPKHGAPVAAVVQVCSLDAEPC